jgi:ATP-binding cassette subfamily C (CFTR/MRP) protein 1
LLCYENRFTFAADTLKTTTPLLNKVILTWLTDSYIYVRATDGERTALGLKQPRGIGFGIGLAVALFVMQGASISHVLLGFLN